MLTVFWSLLPIPLGIFCIVYAFVSEKPSGPEANLPTALDSNQQDDFEDPAFEDPDISYLTKRDILYYQILLISLGLGSILYGLDYFISGMAALAKFVFLTGVTISLVIRYRDEKRSKKAQKNVTEGPQMGLVAKKVQQDGHEGRDQKNNQNSPEDKKVAGE